MALPYEVKSIEGLDPVVAKEYIQKGDVYVLDVQGAVPSSKLAEFRDANISLKKQIEAYDGVEPVKVKELLTLENNVKGKQLLDEGKIEELVGTRITGMKTEYESKVSDLTGKLTTSQRQLESLLIDSAIRTAALENAVLPTAIDDVVLRAKNVFKLVDGVATPFNGDKIVYGSDGLSPMTMQEWSKTLTKTAPHLFQGTDGGGTRGSMRSGMDSKNMTASQKISAGLR